MGGYIANLGVLSLAMLAALALGFARVLDAPRWASRAILPAVVLLALATQIALPPDAPLRQSVAAALQAFAILLVLAVPFLGYRWLLRRLRKTRSTPGPQTHPVGFVLIEDDTALDAQTTAEQAEESRIHAPWNRTRFSVAHRDAAGEITASARVVLNMGLAEVSALHLRGAARDAELPTRLLAEIEAEAVRRGAARAALAVYDWQGPEFYAKAGYREYARLGYPAGHDRIYFVKDLP